MNEPFDIFINRSWLPDIGQLTGPLAPLSPFGLDSPRGDLRGEFTQAGLLTVEGKLGPRFLPAFTALARPTRLASLRYIAPDQELEYQSFSGENGEEVSMVTTEDGYKIRWPAVPTSALDVVADFAGTSRERVIDVSLSLPALEARVALALVDATRQAFLMRVTAEGDPAIVSVKATSLVDRLAPDSLHLNRLETLYRELGVSGPTPDEGAVRYALSSLVTKGLAHEENGEFTADGNMLALAGRMLLVSGWFQFDVAAGTQADQITAGCGLVIQGGPRALLLMEHDAGNIRLTGLSGSMFVEMVGSIFGVEPAAAPAEADAGAAMAAVNAEIAGLEAEAAAPPPAPEGLPEADPATEVHPDPEPEQTPVVAAPAMPSAPPNPRPPTVTIPQGAASTPPPPPPSSPVQEAPVPPEQPAAPAAQQRFCEGCGTQRQGDSKFCTKCGKPFG